MVLTGIDNKFGEFAKFYIDSFIFALYNKFDNMKLNYIKCDNERNLIQLTGIARYQNFSIEAYYFEDITRFEYIKKSLFYQIPIDVNEFVQSLCLNASDIEYKEFVFNFDQIYDTVEIYVPGDNHWDSNHKVQYRIKMPCLIQDKMVFYKNNSLKCF
jgi:hypothetical protein